VGRATARVIARGLSVGPVGGSRLPPITIQSPYPPGDCLLRIEASLDGQEGPQYWLSRAFPFDTRRRMVGSIEGSFVRVRMSGLSSSHAPFEARVKPEGEGSTLVGELHVGFLRIFGWIWLGLSALFLLGTLLAVVEDYGSQPSVIWAPLMTLGIGVVGVFAIWIGRQWQDDDGREIVARLTAAVAKRPDLDPSWKRPGVHADHRTHPKRPDSGVAGDDATTR
jgi:hypothetical protein